MDPQVSSSFIPKKPLVVERRSAGGVGGLLVFITILVFIASGVAAGAVFAYDQYLNSSLASKGESLKRAEGAYDPGVIQNLIRLDTRITESGKILNKHISPSAIFAFLSNETLERVQLTSFDYTRASDGTVSINLDGQADSFSTLALQSDQFGSNTMLKDVIFSNIDIEPKTGKVNFSVKAGVDSGALLYSKSLTPSAAAPSTPVESEASTTTQ